MCAMNSMAGGFDFRGVVYDVGLMYGGKNCSVPEYRKDEVAYDMNVIANILGCNAVRIEGEDIDRLVYAAREAGRQGLRVMFNPWKHEADSAQTVAYIQEAAKKAQILCDEGIDLVLVVGCEYSLFCKGVFPGDTFNDRMNYLMSLSSVPDAEEQLRKRCVSLNRILASLVKAARKEFSGKLTYSSGTWESVDWSPFDIIGVDYYHNNESDEDYVAGLERYVRIGKPTVVMEVGCCTYTGAGSRGSFGFSILKGVNSDGSGIYENGIAPERNETEQADYVETNISLIRESGAAGVFIFVFSYPIYPYNPTGLDLDMTSYALVKSFPPDSPRSHKLPSWEPKQSFFRLGKIFTSMKEDR